MMKPVKILFVLLAIFFARERAFAQSVKDTIRFAESVLSMEKKKIVLQYMHLTEAEKASFWPVYDSYYNATQYLELECHQILHELAKGHNTLTASDIEKFSKRMLQNDLSLAKARIQYYRKFKRAISAKRATEFMQLDNSIRMMVRQQVQQNAMPVVAMQAQLR